MSEETKVIEDKPERQNALIAVGHPGAGALLPQNFEGMWRMATIMAKSGMMPKGVSTPEAVFVAIQMGLEVGLSPMQAVQNIAVINGRPSIWGDAALGLVMASGQLEDFSEDFSGTQFSDDWKAVCSAKRRGRAKPIIREFSWRDAKVASLQAKAGPWKEYPRRMLQMRARSWTLRDGFADVLKGLLLREEVQDIDMEKQPDGSFAKIVSLEERIAKAAEPTEPQEPGYPFLRLKTTGVREFFNKYAEEMKTWPAEMRAAWNDKLNKVSLSPAERGTMALSTEVQPLPQEEGKLDFLAEPQRNDQAAVQIACPDNPGETRNPEWCSTSCPHPPCENYDKFMGYKE